MSETKVEDAIGPDRLGSLATASSPPAPAHDAAWDALRRLTPARIGLGHAGVSMPTRAHLAFQVSHAQARDAVHRPLDRGAVTRGIEALGLRALMLHSAAADRQTYLQRPDLGRRLDDASRSLLGSLQPAARPTAVPSMTVPNETRTSADESTGFPLECDAASTSGAGGASQGIVLALVVADGLSALAVERHAAAVIGHLMKPFGAAEREAWRLAPVAIVEQGRVAVGDEIGERLGADVVAVLIGERPGLSSPDSLGIYITWQPRVGRSDAERNCISNVRPEGLAPPAAASKLAYLLDAAARQRTTGVALKDDADDPPDRPVDWRSSFLLRR